MRTTASACFLTINNLLGIAVGYYYFGAVSDALKPTYGDDSLRYAIYSGLGFYVVSSVLFLFASRTIKAHWVDNDLRIAPGNLMPDRESTKNGRLDRPREPIRPTEHQDRDWSWQTRSRPRPRFPDYLCSATAAFAGFDLDERCGQRPADVPEDDGGAYGRISSFAEEYAAMETSS